MAEPRSRGVACPGGAHGTRSPGDDRMLEDRGDLLRCLFDGRADTSPLSDSSGKCGTPTPTVRACGCCCIWTDCAVEEEEVREDSGLDLTCGDTWGDPLGDVCRDDCCDNRREFRGEAVRLCLASKAEHAASSALEPLCFDRGWLPNSATD